MICICDSPLAYLSTPTLCSVARLVVLYPLTCNLQRMFLTGMWKAIPTKQPSYGRRMNRETVRTSHTSTLVIARFASLISCRTFIHRQLLEQTCQVANALRRDGVKKGDHVAIYMPMSPLLVASMLACARIGAVHR